jgi:glycosyltransferase involved in cell wall biosynthesis
VDFWNIDSLANAICSILRHKSLAQTLRKKSKKTLQQITWDIAATRIKILYHEVANQT